MNSALFSWLRNTFSPDPNSWSDQEPLLRWNNRVPWTIGNSYEGAFAFGATGGGKTSGWIKPATAAVLRAGYGALIQTTKEDDVATYEQLIGTVGRDCSLLRVGPDHKLEFNLIRHALGTEKEIGSGIENVVQLFGVVMDLVGSNKPGSGEDSIWREAAKQLLRNAINLVFMATDNIELEWVRRTVESMPQNRSMASDPVWKRESTAFQLLQQAQTRWPNAHNLQIAEQHLFCDFPALAPETRTSVLFNFSAVLMELVAREPLRSMFFGATNYTTDLLLRGAIILVDAPVDSLGQVGRLANGLLRWAAQRTLDRRTDIGTDSARPVAVVWDECQKTLRKSDQSFQATARSRRCCTLAAAQDLPTLREALGKDLALGFLANMNTKAFFRNQDPDTNRFMSELFGKEWREQESRTRGHKGHTSKTVSQRLEDVVPAEAAHYLKPGGRDHGYQVTGILTRGGQRFPNGKPAWKIRVDQRRLFPSLVTGKRTVVTAILRPAPDFRHLQD